jgi:hypothetical protein
MKAKSIFLLLGLVMGLSLPEPSYSQQSLPANIHQFTSEKEAREIIYNITDAVGLKPNFEIKAGDVGNAAALVYRGKRFIIYNPVFIRQISKAVQTNWGGISILAHEIGHHLNGHTLTGSGSRPDLELEADEFSGYVLRKMGASLAEAQVAMRILSSKNDSRTHPGQNKRLASIEKGWLHAEAQIASIYKPEKHKPIERVNEPSLPKNNKPKAETVAAFQFPSHYIFKTVYFDEVPDRKFYITVKSNFIHVNNNGYTVLGKLVKQGRSLLLTMGNNRYLIITPNGTVLNQAKQRVGYLSS